MPSGTATPSRFLWQEQGLQWEAVGWFCSLTFSCVSCKCCGFQAGRPWQGSVAGRLQPLGSVLLRLEGLDPTKTCSKQEQGSDCALGSALLRPRLEYWVQI